MELERASATARLSASAHELDDAVHQEHEHRAALDRHDRSERVVDCGRCLADLVDVDAPALCLPDPGADLRRGPEQVDEVKLVLDTVEMRAQEGRLAVDVGRELVLVVRAVRTERQSWSSAARSGPASSTGLGASISALGSRSWFSCRPRATPWSSVGDRPSARPRSSAGASASSSNRSSTKAAQRCSNSTRALISSSTSKPGGRPASSGCSARMRCAKPCSVVSAVSSTWSSA